MFSDWVSFLTYPNLFEIKDFVVVVVVTPQSLKERKEERSFFYTNS
jgi:hypothetical protein